MLLKVCELSDEETVVSGSSGLWVVSPYGITESSGCRIREEIYHFARPLAFLHRPPEFRLEQPGVVSEESGTQVRRGA